MKQATMKYLLLGAGALLLIGGTAAATTYVGRDDQPKTQAAVSQQPVRVYAQNEPPCDDKNIVGTLAGGVAGGVLGNQIGSGSGRTVATVGGAVGGAYLGNEYLPTRNATCR